MKLSKKVNSYDISHLVDEDGQLTDEQLASLGLADVTYSEPEFKHDCEINNGLTLGYYQAQDKSIWRSDYIQSQDAVELVRLSQADIKALKQALEDY